MNYGMKFNHILKMSFLNDHDNKQYGNPVLYCVCIADNRTLEVKFWQSTHKFSFNSKHMTKAYEWKEGKVKRN